MECSQSKDREDGAPNFSGDETASQCKICESAAASQHKIQEMVSHSDIGDIIKDLGRDDLHRFYFSLGLLSPDIEKAEYDANTTSVDLRARKVLETWRKREAGEATREKVLQALENSGNLVARRDLEKKWNSNANMVSYQRHQNAKVCKEELIRFYKHKMSQVQLLPWCDDARDMDDIYVSLELEKQSYKGTLKLEKNEDLATLKKHKDMPATRVLVKGVAGSGKSTLLARLAYRWAQQSSDCPLSKYDLLFMISLREVQRDSSLIDAVFQQLLARDTKVSKGDLLTYIESHSDRIIILLDGFDEYKAKNLSKEQFGINGILAFKLLRDCRVILSTRPYEHLGSHQSHYISVKLTGFSPTNVTSYIEKFFEGINTGMVNGLRRRLEGSKKLSSLSIIPVMLMLMCLLWEDEQKLPDTQSELYQEFSLYLWRKYCFKQGITVKDEDNCGGTYFDTAIRDLGQVALAGLCPKGNTHQEKLIFAETDFGKSADLLDKGCSIGLLTRERLRSRLNKHSAVTFLHKSFQEFCAAKYWANLLEKNPKGFYSMLLQINTWDAFTGKIELLKFCCGLLQNIGTIVIIHHVLNIFITKWSDAKVVYVSDRIGYGTLNDIPFDKYILTLVNEDQTSLRDNICDLFKTSPELIEFFKHNPSFQQLANIDSFKQIFTGFELVVVGDEYWGFESDYQTHPHISMFHHYVKSKSGSSLALTAVKSVKFDEIPAESWGVIGDTLECMPQVKKLDIRLTQRMKPLQLIHFKHLCKKLSTLSTLKEVVLRGEDTRSDHPSLIIWSTPEMIASLLDAIQIKIERVSMQNVHVAHAIGHIGHIMTHHLQILEFFNAKLKEDHIKIVSDFLPQVPNLQVLDLSYNTVGMGIVPLALQLQKCTKLTRLELWKTQLTDHGVIELAKKFKFLKGLTHLDISRNDLGNTGAHAVFKNLRHLNNLNMFDFQARVDNKCSDLVEACVTAIGEKIPKTGFLVIQTRYPQGMNYEEFERIRKLELKPQ